MYHPPSGATHVSSRTTRFTIVPLTVLAAIAIGGCGSSSKRADSVTGPPKVVALAVTSPASGSVINAESVTIHDTVERPVAAVEVQNRPAAVGDGAFTASAVLHCGTTTIEVIASAPGDAPGSTSITVTRPTSNVLATTATRAASAVGKSQATDASPSLSGGWSSATAAWTVILASETSRGDAEAAASRATRAGLADVGVLFSSDHASLRPG